MTGLAAPRNARIVHDLLWREKHTFAALRGSAEDIPSNILADRLQRLTERGLVRRELYQERSPRFAYRLTDTGTALEPALTGILYWGHNGPEGGMPSGCSENNRARTSAARVSGNSCIHRRTGA